MTESPWTFSGESSAVGGSDVITLVDGTTFLVCEASGDLLGHGARGLFMYDTRVLSRWELTINDTAVQALSVTPNGPFSAAFVGRLEDPALADAPISVIQRRHIGRGMREDLDVRNHGSKPLVLFLKLTIGSDFGGLFEVKGGQPTGPECPVLELRPGVVSIVGRDTPQIQAVEATTVTCSVPPDAVQGGQLVWQFMLDPGERWKNCLLVGVHVAGAPVEPSYQCGQPIEEAIPVSRLRQWRHEVTTADTDNKVLATAVNKAAEDLGALRIFDPDHPERVVVAAGAPWFMTLFGRDSLLTSWMALPLDQDLARGVLEELADNQGVITDHRSEEQPGRILHEVRFDSASARLLGGSSTYYGTVDATPLFVMLVGELARWTGLTDTVRSLMPAVDRAIMWIDTFGDADGDGFVEYFRGSPEGLENQGWKDSWDGIRHADGQIARGPIALSEVQGYVYAAFKARAELAAALGNPADAEAFHQRASLLQKAFQERFWIPEVGWYAIGLDGDKQPIGSLASNLGHLLWTGIVPEEYARHLAAHLTGPSMFSGWGVRTLSTNNPAYNPLSYHCGSVWPHDTALAAAGLSRYHCDEEAQRLTNGLLETSMWSNGRLPELFAGFDQTDIGSPVPYPASCSPQAWAAASPLLLVRTMLGLEPNLLTGHVRLRPRLPPGTTRLTLTDIPLNDHRVEIAVTPDAVDIKGLPDHIIIEIDGVEIDGVETEGA